MTFLRLYHLIKYMREHHPMRYNRMTEILKNLGSVTMSSSFLLKSHFLVRYSSLAGLKLLLLITVINKTGPRK